MAGDDRQTCTHKQKGKNTRTIFPRFILQLRDPKLARLVLFSLFSLHSFFLLLEKAVSNLNISPKRRLRKIPENTRTKPCLISNVMSDILLRTKHIQIKAQAFGSSSRIFRPLGTETRDWCVQQGTGRSVDGSVFLSSICSAWVGSSGFRP